MFAAVALVLAIAGPLRAQEKPLDSDSAWELAAARLARLEEDAVEPLILILKHGPNEARPLASVTLQEIGDSAIEPLVGILGSTKEGREWARFDLLAIGGQSIAAASSVTQA